MRPCWRGYSVLQFLKAGGKEQSQTQTIVRPDYTDSADNIELEVLAEGEEKPFLVGTGGITQTV